MSNLYKILDDLCKERGISNYRMCKDVKMQPSIMSDLKNGRRFTVKAETAQRLAEYFGVSVAYLLGEEEKPAPISEDELDSKQDIELMNLIRMLPDEAKEREIAYLRSLLDGKDK